MTSDAELLSRYAKQHDESAFAELVRRHIDHVYSAARRLVGGDAHLAEDIAQQVFTSLARQAHSLQKHAALGGWLHTTARFTAAKVVRSEQRRRRREEAIMIPEPASAAEWEQVCSVLDRSIGELSAADRDALVLRFFERKPFGDIGQVLGLTENAARMRVERALDKLRRRLSENGVVSSAAALTVALSQNAVEAAPAALDTSIITAALHAATTGKASGSWFLTTSGKASLATAVVIIGISMLLIPRRDDPSRGAAMSEVQPPDPGPPTAQAVPEVGVTPPTGSNLSVLSGIEGRLQAMFDQFPLLTPRVSSSGKPSFQHFPLRNPIQVDGTNYYGFRFRVPARQNKEDFLWAFVNPAERIWSGIIPPANRHVHFQHSASAHKNDYLTTQGLAPVRRITLIMKSVAGTDLRDEETYLVWFRFSNLAVEEMPIAIAFADVFETANSDPLPALENAIGLDRDTSPPIVNPANGHQYILLKAAKWEESVAKARELGGHLATVRNQGENDWLVKTFGHYGGVPRLLWIGLNDTEKKFHFGWNSRESASYTHWADGEPNNSGRGETFVAIYYPGHSQAGKWNDWNDRTHDPIGLPMNAVVEIIPATRPALSESDSKSSTSTGPLAEAGNSDLGTPGTGGRDDLVVTEIRPELVIASETGSIKLQWSIDAADYMLEVTTNLAQPFTMFGYSEITDVNAGVIHVTITNPVPQMYFRLSKPRPPTPRAAADK